MGWLKRRIIKDMEPTENELARRWIPVTERLPALTVPFYKTPIADSRGFGEKSEPVASEPVLVWDGRIQSVAICFGERNWEMAAGDNFGFEKSGEVTHWMPLPAPPTEAK